MLDSLLGLVSVLANNDPAQLSDNLQEIHQTIIAPDQRREQSLTNLPLLKPTLLDYIQKGSDICKCQYNDRCIKQGISATQNTAEKFKTIIAGIVPSLLPPAQQLNYKNISSLLPTISPMPVLCINVQNPNLHVKDNYPAARLDFFLKELHTSTQNICSCGSNTLCLDTTKVTLIAVYNNLDTSKILNNYTKAMWLTYDTLSNICLNFPSDDNKKIPIPDNLPIKQTVVKQPPLTIEQAKGYIGYPITVTRKSGLVQSGILAQITDKILTLKIQLDSGNVNDHIPLATILSIKANQPKEEL